MGVENLLHFLKEITVSTNLDNLEIKGKVIGIDAMALLHRGGISCSRELALGLFASKHIAFVMSIVKLFLSRGVLPHDIYMVVDNLDRPSPMKAATNQDRRNRRTQALENALRLEKEGKSAEAEQFFRAAVTINQNSVALLLEACESAGIKFVLSHCEADSHLAYLSMMGAIDLVVGEDSDYLAYGASRCCFKLQKNGSCDIVESRLLHRVFPNWNVEQFVLFCVLAGCDYFKCPKIGIKRAFQIVQSHPTLIEIKFHLRTAHGLTKQEIVQFVRAFLVFRHAPPLHLLQPLPDEGGLMGALEVLNSSDIDLSFLFGCTQNANRGIASGHPTADEESNWEYDSGIDWERSSRSASCGGPTRMPRNIAETRGARPQPQVALDMWSFDYSPSKADSGEASGKPRKSRKRSVSKVAEPTSVARGALQKQLSHWSAHDAPLPNLHSLRRRLQTSYTLPSQRSITVQRHEVGLDDQRDEATMVPTASPPCSLQELPQSTLQSISYLEDAPYPPVEFFQSARGSGPAERGLFAKDPKIGTCRSEPFFDTNAMPDSQLQKMSNDEQFFDHGAPFLSPYAPLLYSVQSSFIPPYHFQPQPLPPPPPPPLPPPQRFFNTARPSSPDSSNIMHRAPFFIPSTYTHSMLDVASAYSPWDSLRGDRSGPTHTHGLRYY